VAKRKPKRNPHKFVSEEPDGDYEYMRRRKELLKGSKKKLKQFKRKK